MWLLRPFSSFEHLQGWRIYSLSSQPVPMSFQKVSMSFHKVKHFLLTYNQNCYVGDYSCCPSRCHCTCYLHQLAVDVWYSVQLRGKLRENSFTSTESIIKVQSCIRNLNASAFSFLKHHSVNAPGQSNFSSLHAPGIYLNNKNEPSDDQ